MERDPNTGLMITGEDDTTVSLSTQPLNASSTNNLAAGQVNPGPDTQTGAEPKESEDQEFPVLEKDDDGNTVVAS